MRVIVATNNRGKLLELRALLPNGLELLTLNDLGLDSPPETGQTFKENALIKARAAARWADAAIADDSGLVVDALAGQPGVLSSRYAGDGATDADNNAKLLRALESTREEQRSARFVSVVAFVSRDGRELTATGRVEGRIGRAERGTGGFGYDPLLIVDDPDAVEFTGRTMAELTLDEKNQISHRARAWVEHNRRLVDKLSNGQLAYVHVPNTGQGGYTAFNRYYFAQQDKKGAIIDERYNGGGSAADYIIEVLQRDFDGYFNNVAGDRMMFTSPSAGIWGPKVMIINEMAGSGGDLMPYMFRRRKIGPLVGKRTWGGLVHTADTPGFIDGGSMIAPRGGFVDRDGKWAVENEGVAPDIDVENFPKDVIAGKDPQLERAVEEALKLLKANPIDRKTVEPPGPTWGQRKRSGGGGQ